MNARSAVVLGFSLMWGMPAWSQPGNDPPPPFEMPASLQPTVGFWVRVYSEWSTRQYALHDTAQVHVVYRVVDVGGLALDDADGPVERHRKKGARDALLQAETEAVEEALKTLDTTRPAQVRGLTGVERDVFLAWDHARTNPERFANARHRVRAQRGAADRYELGWQQSGRFVGAIQQELQRAGLPRGLVALAMTESLLNLHAVSSSGALGPWQFLRGTGAEYLAVNDLVDERRDPVLATRAAAQYLTQSKQRLGSWGVAITGYNYGMNGMARAVAQLGTSDIEQVLARYQTRAFGFAAKNYYAEFLASQHVLSHADQYFPTAKPMAPWRYDVVVLPHEVQASVLKRAGVTRSQLAELNPALSAAALDGVVRLPSGFALRVPFGKGKDALLALPAVSVAGTPAPVEHTVQAGETLFAIARKHHVRAAQLASFNNLDVAGALAAGRRLTIPPVGARFTLLPEAAGAAPGDVVAQVSMPSAVGLPKFAQVFLRRDALPVLALGPTPARRAGTTLVSALPPPPPPPLAPLLVALPADAWTDVAPQARRVVAGRKVLAGPLRAQMVEDTEAVDVVVGDAVLPEADCVVGAPWTDGAPRGFPALMGPAETPAS